MTFLFWAAAIVVFAIAEAATTALVSIWFAVGAAAAMVASIFTASVRIPSAPWGWLVPSAWITPGSSPMWSTLPGC